MPRSRSFTEGPTETGDHSFNEPSEAAKLADAASPHHTTPRRRQYRAESGIPNLRSPQLPTATKKFISVRLS